MSRASHHGRQVKPAFTLVELLVVISIISLLIALLLPALKSARQAGQATSCLSTVRQVVMASHMYTGDFKDYLPWAIAPTTGNPYHVRKAYWFSALAETNHYYPKSGFKCPADASPNSWFTTISTSTDWQISYGYSGVLGNEYLRITATPTSPNYPKLAAKRVMDFRSQGGSNTQPTRAFFIFDYTNVPGMALPSPLVLNNKIDTNPGFGTSRLSTRHAGGQDLLNASTANFPAMAGTRGLGNFGFIDGHAASLKPPFATSMFAPDPTFASQYGHAGFF